jgi:hypothetical protein
VGICNRTLAEAHCPRIAAAFGGILGATSGMVMARENRGDLGGEWRGAGYGALIGGAVGLGLAQGIRQYHGTDVFAFAAVGAAIGASPKGAGIGFGVGAALGSLGWLARPGPWPLFCVPPSC